MNNDSSLDDRTTNENIHFRGWIVKTFLSYTKEIVSAVIIGVAVTVFSATIMNYFSSSTDTDETLMGTEEPLKVNPPQLETTQATNRIYFIKANLASVLAAVSPLKMQIMMYYQETGELPKNPGDIELSAFDLAEHKQIESSYLTTEGAIGVQLSEIFGKDKYLEISPHSSKNGAFIKWNCHTNINKKYLGITKNRMCEYKTK
jgi:hypothetical protein